jgi:beta-glucosidase
MIPKSKRAVVQAVALLSTASWAFAQSPEMRPPERHAWADASLSPDARADMVIEGMTLDEKIQLVHGMGWESIFDPPQAGPGVRALQPWAFIPGIPRLGVPDLQISDSVLGVTGSGGKSRYATAFPSAEAEASSWDLALAAETGSTIATEMRAHGLNMSLGSGVNLTREPRTGRTFEYKGEDPILVGLMVREELKAARAQGLIVGIKHYAVNDQDGGRMFVNSVLDERSMRESDLLPFEIALRNSDIGAVMCSYNKINGIYACENQHLLSDLLKKEFGFKGFVISDWGATHSTVPAALAGLDMEMPGDDFFGTALKYAVERGDVPLARLNDMVHRILRTAFASGVVDSPPQPYVVDVFRGFEAAQKVEEKGAVLLKNTDRQLPLKASTIRSIAVIGGHADAGVLSGGGSSQVSPAGDNPVPPPPITEQNILGPSESVYHRSVPLKGIAAKVPGASVKFDAGIDIASAVALARASQLAIVFAVQNASEGEDLPNLSLSDNQDALIEAVATANPHTIVVLETGGPVTMPWIGKVSAVLEAWFPGIRGSEAIANILFGDVNPSGKLPLTFPRSEADLPHPKLNRQPARAAARSVATASEPSRFVVGDVPARPGFLTNTTPFDAVYDEGLRVGYKWYDAEKKQPLFPFGFGLSYTTYAYSGLKVEPGKGLTVTFDVKNTGDRAGEETAQVYLTLPASAGEPPRRLVGWNKVALGPGEQKTVTIDVEPLFLSVFRVDRHAWEVVTGDYKVWAGPSSRELPLSATVQLSGK